MLRLWRRWKKWRNDWKAIRIAERMYDEYIRVKGCESSVVVRFVENDKTAKKATKLERRLLIAYYKMLFVKCDGDAESMRREKSRQDKEQPHEGV